MDALALLCTLHADGPTSLKRLRASGCSSIDSLIAHSPDDLADALEIERAVARRLLREARLLSERVGPGSLDPEEAPPALGRAGQQEAPPLPATPPAPQASPLDATDHALVARLSRPEVPDVYEPEPEPEPEAVVEPEPEPSPEPEPAPPGGALETGRLPGLDDALIEDLSGLGIKTYEELSRAESLELTRGLGITFAQSRRLRFLARRIAEEQPAPSTEPKVVPPQAESQPEPQAAPQAEPQREPQPQPTEEQGVRIDPAEIEPRPAFAEQFARAAAARRLAETRTNGQMVLGWNFEIPRPEADSLPFASISAPAATPAPIAPPEATHAHLAPPTAPGPEDDIAGPFARA